MDTVQAHSGMMLHNVIPCQDGNAQPEKKFCKRRWKVVAGLTRRWTRRAFWVSLVAEHEGRGQVKQVSRDGRLLAAGSRYLAVHCKEKHSSYLKLTSPGETVQQLCDGSQCEERSRPGAEYGDCTQGNGDLCSTKLPDAERPPFTFYIENYQKAAE